MNENINLCELLKGHEGETFYSPLFGNVTLTGIEHDCKFPIKIKVYDNHYKVWKYYGLTELGQYISEFKDVAECMLFPSKYQRDWNKWIEEQKPKVPKTWSELIKSGKFMQLEACISADDYDNDTSKVRYFTPIEKAALSLLKIHQLIDVGYGGNITNEEWSDKIMDKYVVLYSNNILPNGIQLITFKDLKHPIAFHTKEQRSEFLSYPENVQLIKNFYQIQ